MGTLGDRWVTDHSRHDAAGLRTYKTPLECYGGIATNVLATACVAYGIITTKPTRPTGRKIICLLTRKGIDLAPVLTETEMVL